MNQLLHKEEFERILSNYQPSQATLDTARDLRIVLLIGITSSGRNTIIQGLVRRGGYHEFVTDTTRQPRSNNGVMEEHGKEYYFRSEEDFLKRLEEGKYLEAAIIHGQQISGTSFEQLNLSREKRSIAIGDFENTGALSLLKLDIDCQVYFLIPPSFEEWMKRLTARGVLDQQEIHRRLVSAEQQLQEALEEPRFSIVVNDRLDQTVELLDKQIKGQFPPARDQVVFDTAWHLLNDLKHHLSS